MRIQGKAKGKIDEKRFYIPGIHLKDNCPKCEQEIDKDMGKYDYFSYPMIGKPIKYGFYCGDCDEEWDVKLIIDISVSSV